MSTPLLRSLLFLSSYAPATFVVAVRIAFTDLHGAAGLFAVALVLVLAAVLAFRLLATGTRSRVTVLSVEPLREVFTGHLLGYVLPFILIDLDDSSAVAASLAFVAILGLVYVRSNLLYLNPLLALAGFRLYSIWAVQEPGPREPLSFLVIGRIPHLARGAALVATGQDAAVRFVRLNQP